MCCFFASLMFFGPRFAYLVYWITRACSSKYCFGLAELPIYGEPAGPDLRSMDPADVGNHFPHERLGLALARLRTYGRCRQLHWRHCQPPESSGLSRERPIQDFVS